MKLFRRFIPLIAAIFLIATLYHLSNKNLNVKKIELEVSNLLRASEPHSKFWRRFAAVLAAAEPNCNGTACHHSEMKNGAARAKGTAKSKNWQTDMPQSMVTNSDDWVASLRDAHSLFVDTLTKNTPKLEYTPGSRGIVTTAGAYHLPVLLVSLLMLRRTGSKLPVEVLITSREEYEPQICDVVYPALNAKCIVLSDILDHSSHKFGIQGYQYKVFAMMFSSFENILFLDSDNFPVHPPELLFNTAPYTTHGFILWKDFWTPTFSPLLSKITGISMEILQRRSTIEAGQIMLSKKHTQRRFYWPLTTIYTGVTIIDYVDKADQAKEIKIHSPPQHSP